MFLKSFVSLLVCPWSRRRRAEIVTVRSLFIENRDRFRKLLLGDALNGNYRTAPEFDRRSYVRNQEAFLCLKIAELDLELLSLRRTEKRVIQTQEKIVELYRDRMYLTSQALFSEQERNDPNMKPYLKRLPLYEHALDKCERELREIGETLE